MRKPVVKIIVLFAMLLLVLGASVLLYDFYDIASAPYDVGGYRENTVYVPSGGFNVPATAGQRNSPVPERVMFISPDHDDHIIVRMPPGDIFRGSLILINQDHRFDIPEVWNYVSIEERKSLSYRAIGQDLLIGESVIEPLNAMLDSFYAETGRDTVAVISAFRTYERQQEILNEYISLVGRLEALRWAAPPGHSEHHAGLAVDFGLFNNGVLRTFLGTGVYSWFRENSFNYGFILRFPDEKTDVTHTAYEPWHYRFVGLPHSYFIHNNGLCLEEYIELIMGYTRDEPFLGEFNGNTYEVYFTSDLEILIPFDCEFDISGNNIDGFIVTVRR